MALVDSHWQIIRYEPEKKLQWDGFVASSRNATFLFCRDYMDYHSDRFDDCSLMALKNGALRALLPANMTEDGILHSHQGLTYGGWLLPKNHFDANDMLDLFEEWKRWSAQYGITEIDYKPLPCHYSLYPSQEDLYALFRHGAVITECNLSEAIDLRNPRGFNTLQKRHLKRAQKSGAQVEELSEVSEFYQMLTRCLSERHNAHPVHSAEELSLLRKRFESNIRLFGCRLNGELHAGICIFDTGRVAHCQYIATTPTGRELGLLSLLADTLIREYFPNHNYFDFGTSNEDHSRKLNAGLIMQKSGMGGSAIACPRYQIRWQ